MSPLIFALALFAQDAAGATAAPVAAEPPAPRNDYLQVAWCYGALRGYLELHDQVMPEVRRIESTYRRPGSRLEDDLKVYADQRRQGETDLKTFQAALVAAEKASARPINVQGAEAVRRGRGVWNVAANVSKARLAQEWMSWTLPAACGSAAEQLQKKALLAGPALKANMEPGESPAPAKAPPAR